MATELSIVSLCAPADRALFNEFNRHRFLMFDTRSDLAWVVLDASQKIPEVNQSPDLLLLFMSQAFLTQPAASSEQMRMAVERHIKGEGRVWPVLLSVVSYKGTLFPLPGWPAVAPIESEWMWSCRREAWASTFAFLEDILRELQEKKR